MSKVKRILSVIMAMVMVLAMSVPTFAANKGADNVYGTADDRGNITVKGIDEEAGKTIEVEAYPVIEAQYTDAGSFSGYKSKYAVTGIAKDTIINTDISTLTPKQLTEYADQVSGTSYTMNRNTAGDYVAEVPVGAYVVLVTGTEAHSYNPMVVSVSYINRDGNTDLKEDELNLNEGVAVAKKSDAPTVDKIITNNPKDKNGNDKGHSVNINDKVKYKVTISSVPNYSGSHPVLNVVDTLCAGLDYDENSIKVNINGTKLGQDKYNFSYDAAKKELKVDFVVDGKYKLNDYKGESIEITYTATLNEHAALNQEGNENDVVLNYTKDSKSTGNDTTDEAKTYTYTFDIGGEASGTTGIITKTGVKNGAETALGGATFRLYKTEDDAVKNENHIDEQQSTEIDATHTVAGQLHFTGLQAGEYYLRETAAPTGYTVNTNIYKIEIIADYYTESTGTNEQGMLKTWSVKVDDKEVATFDVANNWTKTGNGINIKNTKISSLPSTGGIGTTIFTIGGCAIMIVAAGLFFATRRKTQK